MKKSIFLVLFLFIAFLSVGFRSSVVAKENENRILIQETYPVVYDNEVKSNFPDQVFATSPYVNVGHWDFYNSTMRYYLYIDFSALPNNAKIETVELYLDRASSTWDQDGLYQLYWIDTAWDTNTITWNNQPDVSKEFIVGDYTQYGIYKFDLSNWVKGSKVKSNKYHGFMLRKPIESGNNNGLFATVNYPTAGAETKPYLIINYWVVD